MPLKESTASFVGREYCADSSISFLKSSRVSLPTWKKWIFDGFETTNPIIRLNHPSVCGRRVDYENSVSLLIAARNAVVPEMSAELRICAPPAVLRTDFVVFITLFVSAALSVTEKSMTLSLVEKHVL